MEANYDRQPEETAPRRLQRKRTKGWRMGANGVCVTRPGPFSNPFVLGHDDDNPYRLVLWFRECLDRAIHKKPYPSAPSGGAIDEYVFDHFERMADRLHELRGKDLYCFCKEGSPCHGDVLLQLVQERYGDAK